MKKRLAVFALLFAATLSTQQVFATTQTTTTIPSSKEALQALIDQKNQDLQKLSQQIQETRKNYDQTVSQRVSLQKEISTINQNIKQLQLNIKADQVAGDKLGLEIQSINYDIKDIQSAIKDKKSAIGDIMRELQKNDGDNMLVAFLRNQSLADGVMEAQSLDNVRVQLATEIEKYTTLNKELDSKYDQVSEKKQEVEQHKQGLAVRKSLVEDQQQEKTVILAQTKSKESVYQQNLNDLAKKAADIANEVEQIESSLRNDINASTIPIARKGVLADPAPAARLSQGYGRTSFAAVTYNSKYHNGIDLAAPVGTPLYAAEDGVVINMGDQDRYCPRGAYGKYIVIKHYNGLTTIYGHMSKQIVSVGQKVKRGDLIGYMGKTGWATGPHVHFTVWDSDTYKVIQSRTCGPMPVGGDLNPLNYIDR